MGKLKSLEDLKKLREEAKKTTSTRGEQDNQIIVGMGTCGIAAGAREVMNAILEELDKRNLEDVSVSQTGCIGICQQEVLVDVKVSGGERVTYGNVKPEDVARIISNHLINGQIVEDLVVGKPGEDK